MKRLFYAGGSALVTDELAHELLHLSKSLANISRTDVFVLPVESEDGTRGLAEVLLGPSTQLWAAPADGNDSSVDDADAVEQLRAAADAILNPPQIRAVEHSAGADFARFDL